MGNSEEVFPTNTVCISKKERVEQVFVKTIVRLNLLDEAVDQLISN